VRALVLLALVAVMVTATGCGGSKCGPATGVVVNVIDGDTFDLESGVKIRLLLVDAPEITKGHNDCYGKEAATFTGTLISGQTVSLSYDESACTDKYGRTLAYVSVGKTDLNAELAKQGYACELFIPPAGTSREPEFAQYESDAKTNRVGMWGTCSVIPCSMK
jgi:micrococcal nuclease